MLNLSLTRAGFRFTEAESAVQQHFKQLPVRHPGLDGPRYERHRPCQVHSERRNDEFPASDDVDRAQPRNNEADVLENFDAGIDDYMSKPF